MMANEDLWPRELGLGAVTTPVSILRNQASLLAEKTHGILEGAVETATSGDDIYHRFYVVVPAMGRFRYELFRVHHSVTLYPVVVDEIPAVKPPTTYTATSLIPGIPIEQAVLRDEAQFRAWLRETLASEQTQRIISSLYAQASAA
jgi:hypothetical protein